MSQFIRTRRFISTSVYTMKYCDENSFNTYSTVSLCTFLTPTTKMRGVIKFFGLSTCGQWEKRRLFLNYCRINLNIYNKPNFVGATDWQTIAGYRSKWSGLSINEII